MLRARCEVVSACVPRARVRSGRPVEGTELGRVAVELDGADESVAHLQDQAAQRPVGGAEDQGRTTVDMTAVVTTHDPMIVAYADRVLELVDGRLHATEPLPA